MFGVLPAYGFYIRHAKGITFDGVRVGFAAPDTRPATDLAILAELLACRRIDDTLTITPLSGDEWQTRWTAMSAKYPEQFAPVAAR